MSIKLTARDDKILEFFKKGFVADTFLINDIFFHNEKSCNRRLLQLYENELLKRGRKDQHHPYIYYHRRLPDDLQHSLLKSKLYALFKKSELTLIDYHQNYPLINFNADLVFIVEYEGTRILILGDVSTRRAFYPDKYEKLFNEHTALFQEKMKNLPTFTRGIVLACCPKNMPAPFPKYHIHPKQLDEEFPALIDHLKTFKTKRS